MQWYEVWRYVNIILAFVSAGLWFFMKLMPTWGLVPGYRAMASLALLAYPICYGVAAAWAQLSGVAAGPWTAVMFIPVTWTLVASIMGQPDVTYPKDPNAD